MTLKEAINLRHSRRSFTQEAIPADAIAALTRIINEARSITVSGTKTPLNFSLVTNEPKAFSGLFKTYGLFNGVHSYITVAGPKNSPKAMELLGYYGELLILTALTYGLSACWVGLTYDKNAAKVTLSPDEKLYCVIPLGFAKEKTSLGEKLAHRFTSSGEHTAQKVMSTPGASAPAHVPTWFMDGIDAVLKAPSARNKLPVHFIFDRGMVLASADENSGYEYIDLGIAKLHFEIGADYIFYDLRSV